MDILKLKDKILKLRDKITKIKYLVTNRGTIWGRLIED